MKYSVKEFVSAQMNVSNAFELLKNLLNYYNNLVLNFPSFDFKGKSSLVELNDKATEIALVLNAEVEKIEDAAKTICEQSIGFKEEYNSILQNYKSSGDEYNFDNIFLDQTEVRDYLLVYFDSHKDTLTEEQRIEFEELLKLEAKEISDNNYKNANIFEKVGSIAVTSAFSIEMGIIDFLESGYDIYQSYIGIPFTRLCKCDSSWIEKQIATDASEPYKNNKITDYNDLKDYEDSFRMYLNSHNIKSFRFDDEAHDPGFGYSTLKTTATYGCGMVASYVTGIDYKLINGLYSGTGAKLQKTYSSAIKDGTVSNVELIQANSQSFVKGGIDYITLEVAGDLGKSLGKTPFAKEFISDSIKTLKPLTVASVDTIVYGEKFDGKKVLSDTAATAISEFTNSAIKLKLKGAVAKAEERETLETVKNILGEEGYNDSKSGFNMDNALKVVNDTYQSDYVGKTFQKGIKENVKNILKDIQEIF